MNEKSLRSFTFFVAPIIATGIGAYAYFSFNWGGAKLVDPIIAFPDRLPSPNPTPTDYLLNNVGLACDREKVCPDAPTWCLMTIRGDGKIFRCNKEIGEDQEVVKLLHEALNYVHYMNCNKCVK